MSDVSSWHRLAQIGVRHGYFTNGPCVWVDLVPTVGTQKIFARFGCRLRAVPGGAEIWYQDPDAMMRIPPDTVLAFFMTANDPALYTITDLAIATGGPPATTQYFSAMNVQAVAATAGDTLVFSPAQGRSLPFHSHAFQYRSNTPIHAKTLSVRHLGTGTEVYQITPRIVPFKDLSASLEGVVDGAYAMALGGDQTYDFVLGGANRPFGLIEIQPASPRIAATQRLVLNATRIRPQSYEVELKARSVLWRYAILGGGEIKRPVIEGGVAGTAFVGPEPVQIGGRTGVAFTSAQPLPLTDRMVPENGFTLWFRNAGGDDVARQLPIAASGQSRVEKFRHEPRYVATMMVYL